MGVLVDSIGSGNHDIRGVEHPGVLGDSTAIILEKSLSVLVTGIDCEVFILETIGQDTRRETRSIWVLVESSCVLNRFSQ